jgi:hypothetical protein
MYDNARHEQRSKLVPAQAEPKVNILVVEEATIIHSADHLPRIKRN